MPPMPALKPLAEMYPPKARLPQLHEFVESILAEDDAGKPVLRRALTPHEREYVEERRRQLEPWVTPVLHVEAGAEIKRMLLGWGAAGKAMTPAEANAVATQYAMVLTREGVPRWAVEWACRRWGDGSVRPEEIGLDPNKGARIDWAFPPSAPQVCIVARDVARPHRREYHRLERVLGAAPAAPRPKEEGGAGLRRLLDYIEEKKAEEARDRESRRKAPDPEAQRRECARAWAAMGLDPPAVAPGKMLLMPTTYLSLGWTIEEVGGRRVLVASAPPAPEAVGAELDDEIPF